MGLWASSTTGRQEGNNTDIVAPSEEYILFMLHLVWSQYHWSPLVEFCYTSFGQNTVYFYKTAWPEGEKCMLDFHIANNITARWSGREAGTASPTVEQLKICL